MKTNRKSSKQQPPRRKRKGGVVIGFLLATLMSIGFMSVTPRPASALFGIGDVSITVGDIPRRIGDFIKAAADRVQEALKIASDIAFKNSLEAFNARIAQEVLTQISSAGPGQQPLFVTNPKTFFRNVADSAAGDFIDNFTRGISGSTGPGSATSTSRQRFIISRILRTAVGSPVEQCRASCSENFSAINTPGPNFTGPVPEQNAHEARISSVLTRIDAPGGTRELADRDASQVVTCRDVDLPAGPLTPGGYIPWQIVPGACNTGSNGVDCQPTAQECLRRQEEAINTERSVAQQETNQCLRDCQSGGAGFAENVVNDLTATDIFSAVGQLDAREATRAVAVGLSSDKSDFGQLLNAYAQLTVAVQDKIVGEQTAQQSGVLPRTSKVSDVVLVPREATQQSLLTALIGGDDSKSVYTGTGAADIVRGIASFINSPIGKILTNFFNSKCGLNPDACSGPSQASSAIGQLLFGSGGATGFAGARLQFAQFGEIEFLTGDPGRNEVDVTSELTSSGLIDAQFRSAIEDQRTIQEALDQGLLDSQKTFGYDKNGIQPVNGYPYRALQYLRKFRVTPVGWELAAQYSRQFDPRDLSLGFLTQQYDICGQGAKLKECSDTGTSCESDSDCNAAASCIDTAVFANASGQVCSNNVGTSCTEDSQCNGGTCGGSPYCGLVDPNWVLKAPQTYCRRQGAGEEIITKEFVCDQNNVNAANGDVIQPGQQVDVSEDTGAPNCIEGPLNQHPDVGRWIISRNANTCADTQSCIAENDDGTCIAYGYCVQERQTFKFDGTQCDAQFSSCTTFTDSTGQRAAFLSNTLDYRNCSSDVAGCQWYCSAFDESAGQWTCSEPNTNDDPVAVNDVIRLTNNAESCSQSAAGCRQFIRTTAGSNLLPNSGFESFSGAAIDSGIAASFDGWNTVGGISTFPISASDPEITGGNQAAVRVSGSGGDGISQTVDSGHRVYERSFIASVRARADAQCTAQLQIVTDASSITQDIEVTANWATHSALLIVPSQGAVTSTSNAVSYTLLLGGCAGSGFVIDSAQLEENGQSSYKEYGAVNVLHLNGNRLSCTSDDVGCEAYTPRDRSPVVTAQVRDSNRCSESNVGCATFHLEPFSTGPISRAGGFVNIVSPRGEQCSAGYVGCEEYTNLDEVAQGGEGKAYFTSVKQCVKPGHPGEQTYYSWVGDATQGFILRAHPLLKSDVDSGPCTHVQPGTSSGALPTCDDSGQGVASCSAAELATNPDCGEFYDSGLNVFYRIRSQTVTVTDECRPYRNTVDQTDAIAVNDNNVYFLSPRENVACPAAFAGCRAYTGNSGRTARTLFEDNFESGTTVRWVGGINVTESVNLGGHSMYIPVGAGGKAAAFTSDGVIENTLIDGKSYLVSFLAAGADATSSGATIQASFGTATGNNFNADQPLGSGTLSWNTGITPPGPQWQQYTFGPLILTGRDFRLGITVTGGEAYVDNVVLTEVNDSLYLVEPSVPICPASEIGCQAYTDRAGSDHFLKSFSRICSEQVVGCEALIDTQNSSTPFAQTVKNELTPADQVVTIVNDRSTYCSAGNKGCQALGLPQYTTDRNLTDFQTVYLKNDPDRHQLDLCLQEELLCRAYTTSTGTAAFFKDPSFQLCEYRQDGSDIGGTWYQAGTGFRCPIVTPPVEGKPIGASCSRTCVAGDRAAKACVLDSDCPGSTCSGDPSLVGKISDGGGGTVFGQCTVDPSTGADNCLGGTSCLYLAGLCPDEQNGCNAYLDPSDPPGCRAECPLLQQGGSPIYLDPQCQPTRCIGGPDAGQNCQTNDQCEGGICGNASGASVTGIPGCRAYHYLRQSVEENAAECNGQVDTEIGCRPFNDTSKDTLNFRGQ